MSIKNTMLLAILVTSLPMSMAARDKDMTPIYAHTDNQIQGIKSEIYNASITPLPKTSVALHPLVSILNEGMVQLTDATNTLNDAREAHILATSPEEKEATRATIVAAQASQTAARKNVLATLQQIHHVIALKGK